MTDWEPKYRYWVAEKRDSGWVCIHKTNWRWVARRRARRGARKGYAMKVSTR